MSITSRTPLILDNDSVVQHGNASESSHAMTGNSTDFEVSLKSIDCVSSRHSSVSRHTKSKSNLSLRSKSSDLIKRARLAELKVMQAQKEAKQRAEEEQKQAEEELRFIQDKRRREEQRRIRELEYEVERIRLEAKIELEEETKDPESLSNRLRDFDDVNDQGPLLPREAPLNITNDQELPDPPCHPPTADPSPTIRTSTVRETPLPSGNEQNPLEKSGESLTESWIRNLSTSPGRKVQEQLKSEKEESPAFMKSLPRLELPRFSGNPLEWPHFISMFKCLVHDMPLTDTQRMTYLQRALIGDAKRAIGGMLNHGNLYRNALLELEEQFGNEETIAEAYLQTIFNHPQVTEDDFTQLQSLYNTLHIAVETLKGLGFKSDLEATDNVRRAVHKLPNSLKVRWGEKKMEISPKVPSLHDFDLWLRARVRAKASVAEKPISKQRKPPFRPEGNGWRHRPPIKGHNGPPPLTTLTTGVGEPNTPAAEQSPCSICSRRHNIEDCSTFKALNVNERAQLAKEKRLCFRCLKHPSNSDHLAKSCTLRGRCRIENCNRPHHPLIHGAAPVFVGTSVETSVLLQIVPVNIQTPKGAVKTYALLDSGSQASLIVEEFADKIGLQGEPSVLHLGTVNSTHEAKPSRKVAFNVGAIGGPNVREIAVEEAWTIPRLNLPSQRVTQRMIDSWPHLKGLDIPLVDSKHVTILLGANVLDAILHTDVRRGTQGQPVAVNTAFGWTLTGAVKGFVPPERLHVMLIQRVPTTDDLLNQQLQNWWRTDSFGTKYQLEPPRTREDKRAIEILESTVRHVGDRYEAGLLWKEKDVQLCDNRDVAEKRLKSTERTVKRDVVLAEKYSGIIKEYESKGYARKLTAAEAAVPSSKRWFLPHHPVQNPNKPGKVRMVMDAAAKKNGVSLNDNLLIGPDLLNSLTGVLMRFREQRVAIAADIEAMFHQCLVIEEDQPALSFLWRELDINRAPDVYQMRVLIFGAASSPSTANYVLRKTAEDNREDPAFSQETINAVSKNFYMDDFLKSVNDVATASMLQQEMTSLLARGGFRLTKWSSSSREVLSRIPNQELACPTLNLDLDNLPMERTLGMKWNTDSDCLCFSVRLGQPVLTKRGVLSRVSSVFDPLGVLSPYLFLAKSLIQTLWRKRKHWDEPLEPEDLVVWEKWSADLSSLQEFQLPRWTSIDKTSDALVQLHLFGDASEKGFGAVCYIRYTFPDGRIHVSFVIAKNRVAPLKQLSIPRLELQAALLAVRLADTAKRELDLHISDTIFWSDSKTVLRYISNESRRFHTFVANRVSEIQDSSESSQWRYVPTDLNPADDCTRGLHASEITRDCRWISGPSFLWQTEDKWPKEIEPKSPLVEDDIEVKKVVWTGLLEDNGNSLPVPANFSSWIRYRRVVAWILRFVQNTRLHKNERILTPLKVQEIRQAEQVLIKRAQSESFPKDIEYLKSKKKLPSRSRLLPLRPFLDADGFLRVGGRLRKSPLPETARNPIILDPSHAVTSLIIAHYHQRLYCAGVEHVLNELRQQYWILKGLRAVMKASSSCVLCRLRRSRPCPPVMADLPEARLGYEAPPFTNSGVDYFGPIQVRHGRKTEKRYGVLFTCLTTRAVHLEVAHSLDADSCIMAIRRMVARRGKPAHLWSDRGTNFVSANKEIRQAIKRWNQSQIEDQLCQEGIQWHFNPPASPHFGGAWERLVQSAKKSLNAVAARQRVTDETLLTFLTEVESLLNSRPLTHVSSDPQDEEALTPNHFLIGRASNNLPIDVVTDRDMSSRKRWRHAQVMTNHFWKRWLREYVPSLTERRKWQRDVRNLATGDLVLVVDENSPRGRWPLGRITRVLPGDDGRVRAAEVRTKSGTYVRPTAKLCFLEEIPKTSE